MGIEYNPPPTIKEFIKYYLPEELFYCWIEGPFGSGKTTGDFFKLIHLAGLQAKSDDGWRHSRAVIVRNTLPQLKDTTLNTWNYWFRDGEYGHWNATDKIFTLRFNDVECVTMFRPLDTPDDVGRVLSLDINFAVVDEFIEVPLKIIDALSGRLGRYRTPSWAKPSVWGMWGSSNTGTEDNPWFDYLNHLPDNARRFIQPSGLSDKAENLENLPGGRGYYTNLVKGKSHNWIKQYVDAEWGFSAAGQPVTPAFDPSLHVAKSPLLFNPHRKIVVGLDPGITGSAMVLGQQDEDGRLFVLDELVQTQMGAERLISERLKPLLRERYPHAQVVIAPDPAAANRSQSDERTVVEVFRRHFGNENVRPETNNRFPLRLDAMEHFMTTLVPGRGAALAIDPSRCPILLRALRGGWRYSIDQKREHVRGAEPEKNQYSHPGDAFGYLCRYFHRETQREERYGPMGIRKFVPPRTFGPSYHVR